MDRRPNPGGRARLWRATALPLAVLIGAIALGTAGANLQYGYAAATFDESGPLEAMSIVLYGAVLADCIYLAISGTVPLAWSGAAILSVVVLRELDFHKAYTQLPVTSTRYWRSAAVAWPEKAMAALIVGALAALLVLALRASWRPFIRRLRLLDSAAVTLVMSGVLIALAHLLDKLMVVDIIPSRPELFVRSLEESLEFGASVCVFAAMVQWRAKPQTDS